MQRSDNYWHLLEVADLRFNLISFFNPFIFLREENESKTVRRDMQSFSAHAFIVARLSVLPLAEVCLLAPLLIGYGHI